MTIDTADLKRMFDTIAVAIEADKDRLCQLDGVIGDADHGIAMALGFNAVRDALASLDLAATEPQWALAYRFDIALGGREATPANGSTRRA